MRKLLWMLVFAIHTTLTVPAGPAVPWQQGIVLEGLSLESRVLSRPVNYAIYLPPGYHDSSRRYPVVYLLHGFTDNESAWVQFGEVQSAADRGISEGTIPPMIIVMPDAGVSWYINDFAGKEPYEDMFMEELIPWIDDQYRTRPGKEFRAVSGLSMGGYGALLYAMRHPDLFSSCAAFSAGVHTPEEIVQMEDEGYQRIFAHLYGPDLRGQGRLTDHWKSYSPVEMARSLPEETLKKVRWYIDCGDDDFLYKGNSALHVILRNRQIPHQYRVRDGAHNWTYWRTWIIEGLRFVGEGFRR
jgi:enterochelin esterase-like enzyme